MSFPKNKISRSTSRTKLKPVVAERVTEKASERVSGKIDGALDPQLCNTARLSRDARFDGQFFTAVKTTGIYCRPICPATTPKEQNVTYFATAIAAANAGYRPCLRCRPDSAPGSPAWAGVSNTLQRAVKLIETGALQEGSINDLSERLGISERYLRRLFQQHLGVSPKKFAIYQQCLFAKKLLHQTHLPINEIAFASGFNSVRRFNDCFQQQLHLTPSQVRKAKKLSHASVSANGHLDLKLSYRPPYNWSAMQQFLAQRYITGLEWLGPHSYGRTFNWHGSQGYFTARHIAEQQCFEVEINIDDLSKLNLVVQNIRRILDLDVDMAAVSASLKRHFGAAMPIIEGLRLPGTWSLFEAGIRTILGQQVSIQAAHKLVSRLVVELGEVDELNELDKLNEQFEQIEQSEEPEQNKDCATGVATKMANKPEPILNNLYWFPSPAAIAGNDLEFLSMPGARKATLQRFAQYYLDNDNPDQPEQWLVLKGIGPWTADYAKMRGLSDPDIYLGGDLGVKKARLALMDSVAKTPNQQTALANDGEIEPSKVAPWRSYLTFQLWSQL